MFLFYYWPFLHVCILQGKIYFLLADVETGEIGVDTVELESADAVKAGMAKAYGINGGISGMSNRKSV